PAARRAPASIRAPSAGAPTTGTDRARSARGWPCARPWSAREAASRRPLRLRLERPPALALLAVAAPGRGLAPAGGAAKRRHQAQIGAEDARVALRREARVATLAVHLGPEDVHERVARGGRGERVERRFGVVEPALRDQVAREEKRDRRALGMAPPEPAVEPGGALGLALARVQALEALHEDDHRAPAGEGGALAGDGAGAPERVGGGAEIARALGRLGEEHEEPWLGPGLLETLFEELARPGGILVVQVRFGEEGQPGRVARRGAALDAQELAARLPIVARPHQVLRVRHLRRAPRLAPRAPRRAPAPPAACAGAHARERADQRAARPEGPEVGDRERRARRARGRPVELDRVGIQEREVGGAENDHRAEQRPQPARHRPGAVSGVRYRSSGCAPGSGRARAARRAARASTGARGRRTPAPARRRRGPRRRRSPAAPTARAAVPRSRAAARRASPEGAPRRPARSPAPACRSGRCR